MKKSPAEAQKLIFEVCADAKTPYTEVFGPLTETIYT